MNIGELLQFVLDKLEINTTTVANGVQITISLKGNILVVELLNTAATDAQTNTIKVNLNDIIAQLKELGIKGGNGYESAIIPLLEALMCDNVKSPSQYLSDYRKAKDNLLINILNPLFGFVNKVADKPFDTLTAVLPNLAYFIDNNGIGKVLDNLLSPVTDIIKVLDKNGVSVDKIIEAIAGKSLPDLIGGLIGANLSGLDLRIGNLANCNIQDYLADIINAVLKSNNLNIKIGKIDFGILASLGDLNTVYGAKQAQSSRLPQTKARYLLPCFATSKAFLSTTLPQSISFSATSMQLRRTQQSRASLTAYSQTSQRQTKMILFLQYSISFLLSRQTHSLIIQTSNTRIIRLNILQRLMLIS